MFGNQGAQIPATTIRQDIASNYADTISVDSIASYIEALKTIFVIEDSPVWNPNIRSTTAIRTSDTRYFSDPSIAASKIDTDRMPSPAFLMVLTGVGRYAYRRADGVYVVPIGCLKC